MKQLYIIGIGPGSPEYLSPAAHKALESCTDLVGHGLYLNLLGELTDGKTRHKTPMGEELARATVALDLAANGQTTALVSSGDAGIYGMATVVFELLARKPKPEWEAVAIEVLPGISAMQAVAARVGAPLAHDFCVISLSDLLTPWELILKRIDLAGQGDFAVALYNAVSHKRSWQLIAARDTLLRYRKPDTPVIVAFNVTRKGEQLNLMTLAELDPEPLNMLSLVLVGNSETRRTGQWIYTPRGYHTKPELADT
ncbi:MAG: precorrin-3B C(17)-methyltransferase [Candidatus Contendobacter odensis]|uniref:Precorrin-3B C(17)-methyltransferase n=1 Tax=Candidatus Contendibacter odensensis TaxID=1400860 RepID=A0A2G6PEB0_9GAMM|nr:MAG: precorrin-3B C(17)-methyltransferase [Candidatus Contendobacter odensis]